MMGCNISSTADSSDTNSFLSRRTSASYRDVPIRKLYQLKEVNEGSLYDGSRGSRSDLENSKPFPLLDSIAKNAAHGSPHPTRPDSRKLSLTSIKSDEIALKKTPTELKSNSSTVSSRSSSAKSTGLSNACTASLKSSSSSSRKIYNNSRKSLSISPKSNVTKSPTVTDTSHIQESILNNSLQESQGDSSSKQSSSQPSPNNSTATYTIESGESSRRNSIKTVQSLSNIENDTLKQECVPDTQTTDQEENEQDSNAILPNDSVGGIEGTDLPSNEDIEPIVEANECPKKEDIDNQVEEVQEENSSLEAADTDNEPKAGNNDLNTDLVTNDNNEKSPQANISENNEQDKDALSNYHAMEHLPDNGRTEARKPFPLERKASSISAAVSISDLLSDTDSVEDLPCSLAASSSGLVIPRPPTSRKKKGSKSRNSSAQSVHSFSFCNDSMELKGPHLDPLAESYLRNKYDDGQRMNDDDGESIAGTRDTLSNEMNIIEAENSLAKWLGEAGRENAESNNININETNDNTLEDNHSLAPEIKKENNDEVALSDLVKETHNEDNLAKSEDGSNMNPTQQPDMVDESVTRIDSALSFISVTNGNSKLKKQDSVVEVKVIRFEIPNSTKGDSPNLTNTMDHDENVGDASENDLHFRNDELAENYIKNNLETETSTDIPKENIYTEKIMPNITNYEAKEPSNLILNSETTDAKEFTGLREDDNFKDAQQHENVLPNPNSVLEPNTIEANILQGNDTIDLFTPEEEKEIYNSKENIVETIGPNSNLICSIELIKSEAEVEVHDTINPNLTETTEKESSSLDGVSNQETAAITENKQIEESYLASHEQQAGFNSDNVKEMDTNNSLNVTKVNNNELESLNDKEKIQPTESLDATEVENCNKNNLAIDNFKESEPKTENISEETTYETESVLNYASDGMNEEKATIPNEISLLATSDQEVIVPKDPYNAINIINPDNTVEEREEEMKTPKINDTTTNQKQSSHEVSNPGTDVFENMESSLSDTVIGTQNVDDGAAVNPDNPAEKDEIITPDLKDTVINSNESLNEENNVQGISNPGEEASQTIESSSSDAITETKTSEDGIIIDPENVAEEIEIGAPDLTNATVNPEESYEKEITIQEDDDLETDVHEVTDSSSSNTVVEASTLNDEIVTGISDDISCIDKETCENAGLDHQFSHSLQSDFENTAQEFNIPQEEVMETNEGNSDDPNLERFSDEVHGGELQMEKQNSDTLLQVSNNTEEIVPKDPYNSINIIPSNIEFTDQNDHLNTSENDTQMLEHNEVKTPNIEEKQTFYSEILSSNNEYPEDCLEDSIGHSVNLDPNDLNTNKDNFPEDNKTSPLIVPLNDLDNYRDHPHLDTDETDAQVDEERNYPLPVNTTPKIDFSDVSDDDSENSSFYETDSDYIIGGDMEPTTFISDREITDDLPIHDAMILNEMIIEQNEPLEIIKEEPLAEITEEIKLQNMYSNKSANVDTEEEEQEYDFSNTDYAKETKEIEKYENERNMEKNNNDSLPFKRVDEISSFNGRGLKRVGRILPSPTGSKSDIESESSERCTSSAKVLMGF